MHPDKKSIFFIPLYTAIITMILFVLAIVFHWMGEPAGNGAGFCEAGYNGLIKQPVNTISNIGFIIAGLVIGYFQATEQFSKTNNLFNRGNFFSTFYATLAVLLGPGSMAMHATTTRIGGFLDMFSMYLIASFIFAYALTRCLKWNSWGFTSAFLLVLSALLYVHTLPYAVPFVGFIGSFGFGVVLILSACIEIFSYFVRKVKIDVRFGLASILTMCLAFFIWNLSLSDSPWCDPSSLIQGHGLWHLLNALAIYFLYRYYVSEDLA